MPLDPDILRKTRSLLRECFGLEDHQLTFDARLREDLDLDSIDLVELDCAVEEEFNVRFEPTDYDKIKTVGDLLNFIQERAS